MKRFAIGLLILILLGFAAVPVWAEETQPDYRGTLSGVISGVYERANTVGLNYRLGDKLTVDGEYQSGNNQPDLLKAGAHYQLFDTLGLSLGVRYDPVTQTTVSYNGLDFAFPFSVNLAITGFYDANSLGADWTRYETALRIQMYEQVYLSAGVRGEKGAIPYLTPEQQVPTLFLKIDGNWEWGKYGLSLQPYLHVEGIWFHDYTFKYRMNDRLSLMVNYQDTFDRKPRYQAGIQWKF